MRKQLTVVWVLLGIATTLFINPRTAEAIPKNQPAQTFAPASPFITAPPTNVPTSLRNSQTLSPAQWLSQQVAMRQGNRATPMSATTIAVRSAAIQKLQDSAGGTVKFAFRTNGTPSEIKGTLFASRVSKATGGTAQNFPEQTARGFLRENQEVLSLTDTDSELTLEKNELDSLNRRHLLFSQKFNGLPVWPCSLTVHLDPQGNVDLMDGAFVATPTGLPDAATVSATQAVQNAREQMAPGDPADNTEPELIVYGPLDDNSRLAWKFDLSAGLTRAWRCVVDASTGSLLLAASLVADAAVTGSGVDALGRTRTLHLWQQGATYFMVDTTKTMYNPSSSPPTVSNVFGGILIFDAQNTPPNANPDFNAASIVQATSSSLNSGWVPDAVGASYGLSETYDYYLARHSRNSIDGVGGSIYGIVRVGINFKNAFWQGQLKIMVFGDNFPSVLDVCGHELTHGVVNTIANGQGLIYQNQSGAMNEAFADIFGKSVEGRSTGTNNWLIGINTPFGLSRNMKDPGSLNSAFGPFPSKMSEFKQLTLQQDSGGVHVNSSIINHCYYLLVEGLNGAISAVDGERIFYRALIFHLQAQSLFIDARHACISAAEELFGVGSAQALKTAEAFNAVELVDAPTTPDPSPVPQVSSADSTLCLNWDGTGYRLIRRETARGDTANGVFLPTIKFLAHERLSVSGDGSFAFFVTQDFDYGVINTDGSSPAVNGTPGLVHSMAMTPDGKKFAFVPLNASGQPTNLVRIVDLVTSGVQTIKLYAPANDGSPQDIIIYADVLDFTSDGRTLVYDAYAETTTSGGGKFAGWTMYALDLPTGQINMLLQLNSAFDFGNPALGKTKNNLVTFEAIERQTGLSYIYATDLADGTIGFIGQPGPAGSLGFPDFTGDDRSIIYSKRNFAQLTGTDLMQQTLAVDGITTNAAPVAWFGNCDVVSMYRRGTFVSSNALPTLTVNSPTNNQVFAPPTNITIQATANDTAGGTIAKVEFYQGSTKLGERTGLPYSLTWSNVPPGKYNLTVRAIDNVGGTTDSSPITIFIGKPPRMTNAIRLNPTTFQFTLAGDAGAVYAIQQSSNLVNWSTLSTVTNVTGTLSVQDSGILGQPRRFYRAILQ